MRNWLRERSRYSQHGFDKARTKPQVIETRKMQQLAKQIQQLANNNQQRSVAQIDSLLIAEGKKRKAMQSIDSQNWGGNRRRS